MCRETENKLNFMNRAFSSWKNSSFRRRRYSQSFNEHLDLFAFIEKCFNIVDPEARRIMQICYISLVILFRPNFMLETERKEEINDDENETDVISVNLISFFWCRLLGLSVETGYRDDSEDQNKGVWKIFFTEYEK